MTTTATSEPTQTLSSPAPATPAPAAPVRTLGIVSFVLGLASIVTGFQFILGIAAIVLGVMALRQEPASGKFAVWGLVTGAVSTMGIFWGIVGAAIFVPFGLIGSAFLGW